MNSMVDWSRVKDLRSEVGSDDFEEIIAMFLEETDAVIAGITKAKSTRSLESELHFLKGSALNIGLASFARLCQQGEKVASSGTLPVDLDEIVQAYWRSRNDLLAQLSSQVAA